MDALLTSPSDKGTANKQLQGEQIAIAGRLLSLTRAEAIQLIDSSGGSYSPRITNRTTLLVQGQTGLLHRDIAAVRRLQTRGHSIEVIREEEFLRRCNIPHRSGLYTLGELVQIVGVSRDRLRGWIRARLIQPVETAETLPYFAFTEVTAVKLLCELTKAGISVAQLGRCVSQLQRWMPNARQALSRLDVLSGRLIVWRKDGQPADVTGQLLFDFADDESECIFVCRSRATSPQSIESPDDPEELFQRALSLEEAEEFAEAASVYGRWLLEHGPASRVCFNLGNVLSALGRQDAAIERYRQAVEIDPFYAEAWNNLGTALAETDDLDSAVAAWQRAVEADADCSDALYNLADALQSSGRSAEAQKYWRAYLERDRQGEWADYAQRCLAGE